MYQRALVLALMAAGVVLPGTTQAADDCSQMFVYSVNQFCRTLSNGFSQCQPVGMVGPAPNCAKPGVPPIMPVPLAPPVMRAPMPYNYMAPFPAPGNGAPSAAVQATPAPAAPAAVSVAAVKPVAPTPTAAPVAAAPAAPVAVVPPAPVVAPIAAPVPATPAAPVSAKVDAVPPTAAPVSPAIIPPAPVTVAAPVATPIVPPAQPASAASASPAAEPAMPPSITLQDGLAHFGFNRAELSGQSRTELDAWLKQPLPKGKTLRVTGHADRLGPASYNLKLSGRRAETVKKYLVGKGVAGQDIKVVAKGETEPVKHCKGGATKATIACLAPNRRVEIDPE